MEITTDGTNPIPVTQAPVEWRFVGYTREHVDGNIDAAILHGDSAMNYRCRVDFLDQKARTCTSAMIVQSMVPPIGDAAWVIPSKIEVIFNPNVGEFIAHDPIADNAVAFSATFSGAKNGLTCHGFNSNHQDDYGEYISIAPVESNVDSTQSLGTDNCSSNHPIACCAAVP